MTILFPLKRAKKITSDFGPRSGGFHYGVDYAAQKGTAVLAALDGTVVGGSNNTTSAGNTVVIKHNGLYTAYYHLSVVYAKKGQKVKQGDVIALSGNTDGNTGGSTGPHLHFMTCKAVKGVWPDKSTCVNPESFDMKMWNEPAKPEPPETILIEGKYNIKVISVDLNIRTKPTALSTDIGSLKSGATVTVLRTFGTWGQLGTGMWVSVKPAYVKKI